ncbi:hypothetical protein ARHIZOSPH14_01760 [Agromyces rhizosphaerae]|uniref:Uncharacterized protein n=1 Tax=Agromyces rhizosphaerae TaxID=88374 RepID=A0A9W6FMI8_9MICO|nr:hypothetical protein [Agromyces rhizosphaerae]GLI25934.1 hypothetical protein ARHIZOSPH14_01760 [Agromyces rhizosphaerae]
MQQSERPEVVATASIVLRADRLELRPAEVAGVSEVRFDQPVDDAAPGIRGFLEAHGVDWEAIEESSDSSYSWGGMTLAAAGGAAGAPLVTVRFEADAIGDVRLLAPERLAVGEVVDTQRHPDAYDCDGQALIDTGSVVEEWELRAETDHDHIVTALVAPVLAGTCG